MIPCGFGPAGRQRLALYHAPRASVAADVAVLLCPPVGQEYMRTHRTVRQLALALSAAGTHVLRFDYLGTGDSAGEVHDGSLADWLDDIALAAEELLDISGATRLQLVGLRAGALLAAAACARGAPAPERLVLWDPVVTGGAWLGELRSLHENLARTMRPVPPVPSNELMGYPYPAGLRSALASLDIESLAPQLQTPRVDLLVSGVPPEYRRLRALLNAAGKVGDLCESGEPGNWLDLPEAFKVMLAPRTVQTLCALLAQGSG